MIASAVQGLMWASIIFSCTVFAFVLVQAWAPAAERRGGRWELEALMIILGPLTSIVIAFYPPGGAAGVLGNVNRVLTDISYLLSVIAIARGLSDRGRKAGGLIAAVSLYYLALILSGLGGVVPGNFPEAYWLTPLLVMAFLLSPGFSLDWILRMSRVSVRIIVSLSLLAVIFFPTIAFNLEEPREVFGLHRVQGITQHPNLLGIIAALGVLLELKNASKRRILWLLVTISALVLAQSSTAYIAALLGVLVLSSRFATSLRVLAGLAVVSGSIFALVSPEYGQKLSALLTDDALTTMLNGRVEIWDATLAGFRENPVFGYGPTLLDSDYRQLYLPGLNFAAQAHNQWYQSLGGAGIVGAAALIILLLTMAKYAFKTTAQTGGLTMALFVLLLIRCVSETPLRPAGASAPTLLIVVVVGALAAAMREARMANQPMDGAPANAERRAVQPA